MSPLAKQNAWPDLCAVKCVHGYNVFLPLFPGTQKSAAYVSDSQRMLRHFAPAHEVFRGGPLRRAPNQTTAPTATLAYTTIKLHPHKTTNCQLLFRTGNREEKIKERKRGEGFHPVPSKCNRHSQKEKKTPRCALQIVGLTRQKSD